VSRECEKVFLLTAAKSQVSLLRHVEMHDCYMRLAPCHAGLSLRQPQDEKQLRLVQLREPERIRLQELVKNEPHLYKFLLDGQLMDFCHCTKCLKFIPMRKAGSL
jgi:hypothetical protein